MKEGSKVEKTLRLVRRGWLNATAPIGMGECFNCHDKWSWKEWHSIPINESSGMFPYCEECNGILSVDEKIRYIDMLIDRWCKESPRRIAEFEARALVAKEAVRNGK